MENVTGSASSPSLQIGDIYYLIFRHKWKIIICAFLGFVGATLAYLFLPPPYYSTSLLYIRYVAESRGVKPTGEETIQLQTPGQRGDTILASELSIISSIDLSRQVATNFGPDKILGPGAVADADAIPMATAVITNGIKVDIAPKSTVMQVTFTHRNPALVQPILNEIVAEYLKRHMEVHRGKGVYDVYLAQQTDQMRAQLANTESELRQAHARAGVVSFEEAKRSNAALLSRVKEDLFAAQSLHAEHTAILNNLTNQSPRDAGGQTVTNAATPPADISQSYLDQLARIDSLRRREQDLLLQFTPENNRVKENRAQLAEALQNKTLLETDHPGLLQQRNYLPMQLGTTPDPFQTKLADEIAILAANEAKIKTLTQQQETLKAEASHLDSMEGPILELIRRRAIEEKNYREMAENLAKARSSEALGGDSVSNINQVQTPSPPMRDWKKTYQILAGIAASGLVFGLGWAVLIEFFFDRSVRRPSDVEKSIRLPLFLSIPNLDHAPALPAPNPEVKLLRNSDPSDTSEAIVPHDEANVLNPYFETLRDRLIAYFDSINLRHRPKLIAVTGLGQHTGVSTTAAGLARSLSETGEGNVLLVDMTHSKNEGTATPFSHGKAISDIDQILESRAASKTENKLFVVSEGTSTEKLSRHLPQRFNKLVPKLKSSDFDYIIFDMPPVSQISVTPRLAPSMDMVLMVVESEKTDKDTAQRAASLLSKANANVGVVLNKTKTYVPAKLFKDREYFLDS